jgi:hypothetical protein
MEAGTKPCSTYVLAGQLELEPGQAFKERLSHSGTGKVVHQLSGATILPISPVLLAERLEHESDEPGFVSQAHRKAQKPRRCSEIVTLPPEVKQHLDSTPDNARQGSDKVQEVEQAAIAVEDVMVPERVKMTFALEAPGEAADRGAAFYDCDVTDPAKRQRISCGRAGQPTPQHHDPR